MTTEERIAIIKNKRYREDEKQIAIQNAENVKRQQLKYEIRELRDRIETVITLANTCVENKINIPQSRYGNNYDSGKAYGYPHEFIAEGIRHHTGLINRPGKYKYVGIRNGGFCGKFDFWTNGNEIWAVHQDNRENKQEPRISDMEDFLKEFPEFEKAFFNWIDSLND